MREVHYILVCYGSSSPKLYWQIFIFAYLAVLQIIGIVLAFQTRKVKLPGLRDSKFIAAIIYISSIILVVIALVTFALRTYINIGTGMIAAGIFFLTTVFLALIFIPKVSIYVVQFCCLPIFKLYYHTNSILPQLALSHVITLLYLIVDGATLERS